MLDAIHSELSDNRKGAYFEVNVNSLSEDTKVIGSHFVFKLETTMEISTKLKARFVPHGNQDRDRFTVQRDSSSADLSVTRDLLSLSVLLRLEIDIRCEKGVYAVKEEAV